VPIPILPDHPNAPLVTVVLPTHNRAALVGRAIESVLAQTRRDWELVVVDDGSADETRAAVAAFVDPRIRYVRNEKALGPAQARNVGIRAAGATRYLGFLDDDDEWLPEKLERQLALFDAGPDDLAAVGCGRVDFAGAGPEVFLPEHRGQVFEDLLARRAKGYAAPLILVRRFPGEPDPVFDADLPCLEDLDFSLRLARRRPLDFVPEPLVRVYRNDGGEHAWNASAAVVGYDRLARKYAQELTQRPWVRSYYSVCAVRELSFEGPLSECRARLREAFRDSPRRFRLSAWYAASLLGRTGLRAAARVLPVRPPRSGGPGSPAA
jgi:O-antigen biosynthesis protein